MLSLMVHQVGAFWGQFAPTSPQPVRYTRGALDLFDNFRGGGSLALPYQPTPGGSGLESGAWQRAPLRASRCAAHDPILTSPSIGSKTDRKTG